MDTRVQGRTDRDGTMLARAGAGLSIVIVVAAILGLGPFAGSVPGPQPSHRVSALR